MTAMSDQDGKEILNFDSAATTPVKKEVLEAMMPYFSDQYYNPSSRYAFDVAMDISRIRFKIATFLGCLTEEIYFTSGASESNSWAIQGWMRAHKDGVVLTTSIEHNSIMALAEDYGDSRITVMPVDQDGILSVATLEKTIDSTRYQHTHADILVAVQYANNEIGTIQDIEGLSKTAKLRGCDFFTDATQAFPSIPMGGCLTNPFIDMLSMSGHKIGAPKGIGLLYIGKHVEIKPLIYGSQNRKMRGGTENVPGIIGLGTAFDSLDTIPFKGISEKRDRLLEAIQKITPVKVNGSREHRLANNLNITFEHFIMGETMAALLRALNVYISLGSACNAQDFSASHVLSAIGLSEEDALRTIRITLPEDITDADIDSAILSITLALSILDNSSGKKTDE